MNADVLIIGAGAAGLMAARELSKAGKKVLILEARDRVGGRIYPLPVEEFGYEAQGGAEFVHGDAPLTRAICKEAGFTLIDTRQWWSIADRASMPTIDRPFSDTEKIVSKLKELKEDVTVAAFLDTYFSSEKSAELREYITRRVEGYDAADVARASAFSLRDELTDESASQQNRLQQGYGEFIRFLETQCKQQGVQIELGQEVVAVDWSRDSVRVRCASGLIYQATQAISTVPPPVFQKIAFTPELSAQKDAAKQIGFGSVIKILTRFKSRWWATDEDEKQFEKKFFMFSREQVPTWWTQYPMLQPVLTGWLPGPKAATLANKSDEQLLEMALGSLANIFHRPTKELSNELVVSKVVNWPADPFALGAYSYTTPESAEAIKLLQQPIEQTIFFAGEAVSESEVGGTVEAALESGVTAAKAVEKA